MRRPGALVGVVLIVGLAGAILAVRSREGNPQFVIAQQSVQPVNASAVQDLLLTTSDPRPGHAGRARAVRCSAGSGGGLGNPWTCVVRYPRLPRIRFRVSVNADRSIDGAGSPEGARASGRLTVSGCCVQTQ
ncbi:MAG TPA: hypothetical protein VED41_13140 [Solirubrobacteraceae bacterium]|nr:hypothetical protein [Solirubrobacteraceae bacterium]